MNLRDYLSDKNRAAFAVELKMSKGYLAQLAAGLRKPSPALAARISAASNGDVTITELIYPDGVPYRASFGVDCLREAAN